MLYPVVVVVFFFFLPFKTSPHLLQLFRIMLQRFFFFCCEAPEMFCGKMRKLPSASRLSR